jgi:hypothetical protein
LNRVARGDFRTARLHIEVGDWIWKPHFGRGGRKFAKAARRGYRHIGRLKSRHIDWQACRCVAE